MQAEFANMVKGLADKNTEKEKETKVQCDAWIAQQLQKKDDAKVDNFFDFIRTQAEKAPAGSALSIGSLNAFGIFAHSIKQDERLKEKYLPIILKCLIDSYIQNDASAKKKILTSNLLSVIMIAQHLIFPNLQSIMEVLFRMKKDQTPEMVTFSSKMDESIIPILKNDQYRVG